MIYVFDSNAFIDIFNNFYRNRFPTLWEKFEKSVTRGQIISVREVHNEIVGYGDALSRWTKNNRLVFQNPSPDELDFVAEIFRVSNFQNMIREKERLQGKPVADPFLVAKAKIFNYCVITQEMLKPHAARIPNVCQHFKVDYSDLEGFMERENWTF